MSLIKMNELTGELNKKGFLTKTLIHNPHVAVRNILLKVGEVIPPHKVEVEVFFYVVEGSGTIVIGEDEFEVTEKDIVTCSPNTYMSVKANKGVPFSFLNVKTPSL